MASNIGVKNAIVLIILSLFALQCTNKVSASGAGSDGGSDEPGSNKPGEIVTQAGIIKGRTEFEVTQEDNQPFTTNVLREFSGRIIVKMKQGGQFTTKNVVEKLISSDPNCRETSRLSEDKIKIKYANMKEPLSFISYRNASEEGELTEEEMKKIVDAVSKDDEVEYVVPEYLRTAASLNFSDENFKKQWALSRYFLDIANEQWRELLDSAQKVRVAIVDTGWRPHPDLDDIVLEDLGYDFIDDPYLAGDEDGHDPDPTDLGNNPPEGTNLTGTSFYHGLFVAGIIGAARNNEKDYPDMINPDSKEGIVGVTTNAEIFYERVLGRKGRGRDADIAQAIRHAAGLPNIADEQYWLTEEGPRRRADIINLSLGGPGVSPLIHDAIKEAVAKGIVVVCAAGNEGDSARTYPASYDECISVGALKITENEPHYIRAPYSNTGSNVEIMAPGGESENPAGRINMEDPYDPNKTVRVPIGIYSTIWRSDNTCALPIEDISDEDEPECSSYYVSAGTSFATPHVSAIAAIMKGLNMDLTPAGIESILFRTATTSSNTDPFKYGYGVLNALEAAKAARDIVNYREIVKVQLKDPLTYNIVKVVETNSNSDFSFSFGDVPDGNYVLHAGTDLNHNGEVCEKGEKFGVYPDSGSAVFSIKKGQKLDKIRILLRPLKRNEDCPNAKEATE